MASNGAQGKTSKLSVVKISADVQIENVPTDAVKR
jgi:hypothetical protein